MRRLPVLAALLFALVAIPVGAVTIDWVTVGDPGNAPDTAGNCAGSNCGSVPEVYRIAKYEITNAQYVEFLNGVANEVDPFHLYKQAGIDFPPVPVGFERYYEVRPGFANKPVNQVTYYDALRFVNWMHNGQGRADTETGTYTLVGGTEKPSSVLFNSGASIFLPSENEWYKAAYYDAATASYFDYPARSDTPTACSTPTAAPNRATCGGQNGNLTDVGAFPGSVSPAGTFDQGGNVAEWIERGAGGDGLRGWIRGGGGGSSPNELAASSSVYVLLVAHDQYLGLRVASPAPEPGLGPLGMTALLGLAAIRRRRARQHAPGSPGTLYQQDTPSRGLKLRTHPIVATLAACLAILGAAPGRARADLVKYVWSGRVEPIAGSGNPWGLTGDGSAVTATDGTPFTIEGLIDVEAVDRDGTLNPGYAEFEPDRGVRLNVGGHVAILTSPRFGFYDDLFSQSDVVRFQAVAEIFDIPLSFAADVRLPTSTFALSPSAAPDPPPSFAGTLPVDLGGAGSSDLLTIPDNAPVAGVLEICGASPTPVQWEVPGVGHAGAIDASVANLEASSLTLYELRGPDFSAGELCSNALSLAYATRDDWTVTLSQPVDALLLYAKYWRGSGGGIDPVTYHFDTPFTILSGMAGASVSNGGTTLSAPGSGALDFFDGILRFEGPIATLSVDSNSAAAAQQSMTFAVVVPEPAAPFGASCSAAAMFALRWLRTRQRPRRV